VTRLIASDLDGTLLQSSGLVSDENQQAIKRALGEGIDLIFVTGRPSRWMDNIAQLTGHTGLALCANGAVLYDLVAEEIVSAEFLPGDVGVLAAQRLRTIDPGISFAVELARKNDDFLIDHNYRPRWEPKVPPRKVTVEEMFETDLVVKLLARPSSNATFDADTFLAEADAALDGLVDVTHSDNFDVLIEMSLLGVNKGSGLAKVAKQRGFNSENVAAMGDMPNDIPMIKWAGLGAAVANAHHRVKEVADLHLPTNDDHAFAHLVDHVLTN
jgi:Cof subfamily protein (haloacid dehalogenase superfamily)